MIRGWHGIKHNAFFLSDVLLEHTHTNGKWIKNDNHWIQRNFNNPTIKKLNHKARSFKNVNYVLYRRRVKHIKI